MAEPVRCGACRKPFNRQFTRCPFCNAPAPSASSTPSPVVPSSVQAIDFSALAEVARQITNPFVPIEFHPATVVALDLFFDLNWGEAGEAPAVEDWRPSPGKLNVIVHLGAFFGELMRRELGGTWRPNPEQATNTLQASLDLPGGTRVFPVSRVYKRFKNGSGDGLATLYGWVRQTLHVEATAAELAGWDRYARYFEGVRRPDLALHFYDHAIALPLDDATRAGLRARRAQSAQAATATPEAKPQEPLAPRPAPAPHVKALEPARPPSALEQALAPHAARAASLAAQGQHAEALEALEAMLALAPDRADAIVGKGEALLALGQPAAALRWLEVLGGRSELEPRRTDCLASAAELLGDVARAERGFRQLAGSEHDLARLSPERRAHCTQRAAALASDPAVRLARILDEVQEVPRCVALLERLNADHPEHVEAWLERGVGLAMLGRIDEAIACFDRAATLQPEEEKSYDHKAAALLKLKRNEDALRAAELGLRSCPRSGQLHTRRGVCLYMLGRREEAVTALARALEADPTHLLAAGFMGETLAQLGKTEEAIVALERYVKPNPGIFNKEVVLKRRRLWSLRNPGRTIDEAAGEAALQAGLVAAQAGRLDEALVHFDAAVAADPLEGILWMHRGTALLKHGRLPEALASYQEAEALLGPTIDATVIKGQVACLLKLGRAEEALACHDREIAGAKNPSRESQQRKARTLVALGRLDEALAIYGRLIAKEPGERSLVEERAAALAAAGRTVAARFAYDAALALAPADAALQAARARLG